MTEISQAQKDRTSAILRDCVRQVANMPSLRIKDFEKALDRVVKKRTFQILKATVRSDSEVKKALEAQEKRLIARKELAKEMRKHWSKLNELKIQTRQMQETYKYYLSAAVCNGAVVGYPNVPPPIIEVSKYPDTIPSCSGIYFAWVNGIVEYVGQSINLLSRCRIGHHRLLEGDKLSWVEIDRAQLNFAESYYIGILKPIRNFGAKAGHILQTNSIKHPQDLT
jgi:hypothetical protein